MNTIQNHNQQQRNSK